MGKLIREWVTSILSEDVNNKIVVYGGRFQPFHKGHHSTYTKLVNEFGRDNVYVATSNKTDNFKSPFTFNEKKLIITSMFDIPSDKVVEIKNPYAPKEILRNFPKETTAFVTVVGDKDRYRLKGKYFKPYHTDMIQKPYMEEGYVYVSPTDSKPISGTDIRNSLSRGSKSQRKAAFKKAYGNYNPKIFNLISGRLHKIESMMEAFLQSIDINKIISEAGTYYADAGEPEEGYLPPGDTRIIDKNGMEGRGEPWFHKMKYTQLHFPVADNMYPSEVDDATDGLHPILKSVYKDYDEIPESDDFITIKEGSTNSALGKSMVDDGPGFFYGNFKTYKSVNDELARRLGFEVVDYIVNLDDDSIFADADRLLDDGYPVSYFPSGISGVDAKSYTYKNFKDSPNYKTWKNHITNVAVSVGYRLVEFIDKNKPNLKKKVKPIIAEGGAYGHMNHPFDIEMNLSFRDLKNITRGALTGNLKLTREKTDGQTLAISWRDDKGGLIAARNKSHLKNNGENALDITGVASKFQGRGELTNAYNFAMVDLSNALKSLSKSQRDSIFQNGACFMNLEVIYPKSVNVIPYGQSLLVFHGTTQYDEMGNVIAQNPTSANRLARLIKSINQNVQDTYTIQGPPITELPKSSKLSSKQDKYLSMIDILQNEYNLSETDGVADYHQAWWESYIDSKSPIKLDNRIKMGLVKRWAFGDKSFRLSINNIGDENILNWAKKIDKQDHNKLVKTNIKKFEDIFLGIGADVLSMMSSVLTANSDEALRMIKARLDDTIANIKKNGSRDKIYKLKMELERLLAAGGKQKIVPNEGIVFTYNGNVYKLTGTFAPLNQILGLMYY